jgi:hypothetical protein
MIKKLTVYGVTNKFMFFIEKWGFRYEYDDFRDMVTVENMPVRYCQKFNAAAGCYLEVDI